MPIWSAERTLSTEMAVDLIEGQFPNLGPISAIPYGSGWDNTAFLVNDAFIFRFPRRATSVALLEREMAVLPQIAPSLPLPIPQPIFFGKPSTLFEWPFAGYRLIHGKTACCVNLSEGNRVEIAPTLGRFLHILHALPTQDIHLHGDSQETLNVSARIPKIEENIAIVCEKNLVEHHLPFDEVLSAATGLEPEQPGSVVHADLYVRHFVMNENRQLAGIIDWGEMHRNDPAIDLAVVFQFLPPGLARDRFWQEYGAPRPQQVRLARLSALDHILTVLRYGSEVNDVDLIREGKIGLGYVMADSE